MLDMNHLQSPLLWQSSGGAGITGSPAFVSRGASSTQVQRQTEQVGLNAQVTGVHHFRHSQASTNHDLGGAVQSPFVTLPYHQDPRAVSEGDLVFVLQSQNNSATLATRNMPTSMSSIPVSITVGPSIFQQENHAPQATSSPALQQQPSLSKRLDHDFFAHPFLVTPTEGRTLTNLEEELPFASPKDLAFSLILSNCVSLYDQALLCHREWKFQHDAQQGPPQDRLLITAHDLYARALQILEHHILPEPFVARSLHDDDITQGKKKSIWLLLMAICTNTAHCAGELRRVTTQLFFYQRLQHYMAISARQIPLTGSACPHMHFFQVHSFLYSQGWGLAAAA